MTLRVRAKESLVARPDHRRIAVVLTGTPGTVHSAGYEHPPGEFRQLTLTVRWDAVILVDGDRSEMAHEFILPGAAAMHLEYLDDAR